MRIRPFRKEDVSELREIHRKAGYAFDVPDFEGLEVGVTVEEDGRIVIDASKKPKVCHLVRNPEQGQESGF